LNDIAIEKTFVWEDGTPFMLDSAMYYQNWYKNRNSPPQNTEPDNDGNSMYGTGTPGEDCVRLYGKVNPALDNGPNAMFPAVPGLWGDKECSSDAAALYPGVCKKVATLLT